MLRSQNETVVCSIPARVILPFATNLAASNFSIDAINDFDEFQNESISLIASAIVNHAVVDKPLF